MELKLSPYLNFNGNTAEAMKFYQSVLGGELSMQTFGDVNMARSPKEKDLILHARLTNPGFSLMASDASPEDQAQFGDNIHLSLMGDDSKKLTDIFNKLAQNGNVDMPLAKQFWGDTFGMLTDKFNIHWMVNISSPQ
jgi:PhnB protein